MWLGIPVSAWITQYGYFGLFTLLMLGIVGLPVPDETLLSFSGFLAYKGKLHLPYTYLTAFLGSCCGISLSYVLGRSLGRKTILRYGPRFHLTQAKLERMEKWFDHLGKWTLTIGYFVPGVRHFTAIVAGASKLRYPVFAVFAYTGALIWSAAFITLGYFFAEAWKQLPDTMHHYVLIFFVVVAVVAAGIWLWRRRKPSA